MWSRWLSFGGRERAERERARTEAGDGGLYSWDRMPLLTWSEAGYKALAASGSNRYFYVVPHVDGGLAGVKVGFHRQGALLETDDFRLSAAGRAALAKLPHDRKALVGACDGGVDAHALRESRAFVRATLPLLDPERVELHMRCLYQNSPDLQMMVGAHPRDARVVVACGFSGGGFQFAPAIGACARACVEQAVFDDAPAPARNHRAAIHPHGGDARVPIAEMCEKFRLDRFGPLE